MAKLPIHKVLVILLVLPMNFTSDVMTKLHDFGEELFHKVCESQPRDNQLVAPFPLATLLILLHMSAGKAPFSEINHNLGLNEEPIESIKDFYLEQLRRLEHGHLFTISNHITVFYQQKSIKDFNLGTTIDSWQSLTVCTKDTPELETHLLLTTKIHFEGLFLYNFASTATRPFYTIYGFEVGAEVLTLLANLKYGEIPGLNAKAVEIPYADSDTSLVIILPNTRGEVVKLEQDLKRFPLNNIEAFLSELWITVVIPKITFQVEFSIKEELKQLGMPSMFENLCKNDDQIRVVDVIYEGSFTINEKSAGIDPILNQNPVNVTDFHINHPFVFIIKSSSNNIYLYGKFGI